MLIEALQEKLENKGVEVSESELKNWVLSESVLNVFAEYYIGLDKPWSIFTPMTYFCLPLLKAMRDSDKLCSYDPHFDSFEDWMTAIDKMIFAFEQTIEDEEVGISISEETEKKIAEGFELFGKHFRSLWD